jgi:hypothetical protein
MKALDPPTYVQPPPDPALAILQQQTQAQDMTALESSVAAADARHALMYGTRMALSGGASLPVLGGMATMGQTPTPQLGRTS